jgi:hypothetical protein
MLDVSHKKNLTLIYSQEKTMKTILTNTIAACALSILEARKNKKALRCKFDCSAKQSMKEKIPSKLNQKRRNNAPPRHDRSHVQYKPGTWVKNGRHPLYYEKQNAPLKQREEFINLQQILSL